MITQPASNALPAFKHSGGRGTSYSYSIIAEFYSGQLTGGTPYGGLIADSAGNLYGTTSQGGAYQMGTVFELSASGSSYVGTTLYSFGGPGDGTDPVDSLYMDSHGALYGTTQYGGPFATSSNSGYGIVFKLTPGASGYTETILHAFQPLPDGHEPRSGVVADANGALYGTTRIGGNSDDGTVFKLTPSGSGYAESIIVNFNSNNGWFPNYGNLLLGKHGVLYGTTSGDATPGNIFELKRSGNRYKEHVLYNFDGAPDGYGPNGTLLSDKKGNLYATTYYGGSCASYGGGCGVVYELKRAGSQYSEIVLYRFKGTSMSGPQDGAFPLAGLVMDSKGELYGTTNQGGNFKTCDGVGCGTVFKLARSGSGGYTETVLHEFEGSSDGYYPAAPLLANGGVFYGLTSSGGNPSNYGGVAFAITPL